MSRPAPGTVVEVRRRPGFSDGAGRALLSDLRDAGLRADAVEAARLYRFPAGYPRRALERAAGGLLCDRVTETWRALPEAGGSAANGSGPRLVELWLLPAVSDPVAESVGRGLRELGLPEAPGLRCGEAYLVRGAFSSRELEKALLKTLVNPVIHRWRLRKPSR